MTIERAIQILKMNEQAKWRSGITYEEEKEAVDMAIEALKTDIDLDDAYEQGYACGWKERFGEPKGLHGEWIIHRNKQGAHIYSVCSKCNVPHLDTDFPNFCENCGSDNRKRVLENE